jgi:hypothetical protein
MNQQNAVTSPSRMRMASRKVRTRTTVAGTAVAVDVLSSIPNRFRFSAFTPRFFSSDEPGYCVDEIGRRSEGL